MKGVLSQACALLGRKIDLLDMDACLMNMAEVAYQLRESVNVIVGSEIEEPFDGWPYAEILTRLSAKPRQDATHFHIDHIGGIGALLSKCSPQTMVLFHPLVKAYLKANRPLSLMRNSGSPACFPL